MIFLLTRTKLATNEPYQRTLPKTILYIFLGRSKNCKKCFEELNKDNNRMGKEKSKAPQSNDTKIKGG